MGLPNRAHQRLADKAWRSPTIANSRPDGKLVREWKGFIFIFDHTKEVGTVVLVTVIATADANTPSNDNEHDAFEPNAKHKKDRINKLRSTAKQRRKGRKTQHQPKPNPKNKGNQQ